MAQDKRKPLIELDGINGKFKRYWPSAKDASEYYGISNVLISYNCTGRLKHAKKKYFRYATDKERQTYSAIEQRLTEAQMETETEPEQIIDLPNITVETIPEKIENPPDDEDGLTPFDKLLKKGKEKLN